MAQPQNILLIGDARRELEQAIGEALPDAWVTSVATVFDGIAELTAGARPDRATPVVRSSGRRTSTARQGIGADRAITSVETANADDLGLTADDMADFVGEDSHINDTDVTRPIGAMPRPTPIRPDRGARYTTIVAAVEPIERRPTPAVQVLRRLAGETRLVLFGHPTLEPISQKMLKAGCDDYLVTPANVQDVRDAIVRRPVIPPRAASAPAPARKAVPAGDASWPAVLPAGGLDLGVVGTLLLDALIHQPHDPISHAVRSLNTKLASLLVLHFHPATSSAPPPAVSEGELLAHPLGPAATPAGTLYAVASPTLVAVDGFRKQVQRLAAMFTRAVALQTRHLALQKMAISDELTGVYNGRYFRHFLTRILEKARQLHFPVTLLLFDIDDFKTYNDQFGHQVGDEILKQTAAMMKKCCREHDLVARIGGDEFAVVFWDKEGPRLPRQPKPGVTSRPPHSPVQVFERFKRLIQSEEFTALGAQGRGKLGISAGLAVYPYEGVDVRSLIAEADKALMQGSKKNGKNRLSLVGEGIAGRT